jgi:hypothetical protein
MSSDFTDRPYPQDHEPDEGYTPTRRPGRRRPEPDEVDDAPRLGSLAQKARGTQLKQARNILITIGVLTVIINLLGLVQFQAEVNKAGARVNATFVAVEYAITGFFILMGVLFLVFGILIHRFPVPATVISLVLYLLATVIMVVLLGLQGGVALLASMGVGLIIRIAIIAALVRAVQSAIAYEKERRESAEHEDR